MILYSLMMKIAAMIIIYRLLPENSGIFLPLMSTALSSDFLTSDITENVEQQKQMKGRLK